MNPLALSSPPAVLIIVEPAFFGELLVEAAIQQKIESILLTGDPSRQEYLSEKFPECKCVLLETHFADSIVSYCSGLPVEQILGLLSGTEHLMHVIGEAGEKIKAFREVICPISKWTGIHAKYKDEMRKALAEHGIPQPKSIAVEFDLQEAKMALETFGGRAIFKPTYLAASWGVRLLESESDLYLAFEELRKLSLPSPFNVPPDRRGILIEEYIAAPAEVSVETFRVAGKTVFYGVTEKFKSAPPHFVEIGHVHPARRILNGVIELPEAELRQTVEQTLDGLRILNGVAHCEVLITTSGCKVVECACRNGGGQIMKLVKLATGVDILAMSVLQAVGRPFSISATLTGAAAIRFISAPAFQLRYEQAAITSTTSLCNLPPSGSLHPHRPDVLQRIGWVICTGETPEIANEKARRSGESVGFDLV
jgi:hypothetical protein